MVSQLAKNSQFYHSQLNETLNPFRDALQALPPAWDWHTTMGAMALNGELSRQASSIAFFNDFVLMQWVLLATLPLLLLFKKIMRAKTVEPEQPMH